MGTLFCCYQKERLYIPSYYSPLQSKSPSPKINIKRKRLILKKCKNCNQSYCKYSPQLYCSNECRLIHENKI